MAWSLHESSMASLGSRAFLGVLWLCLAPMSGCAASDHAVAATGTGGTAGTSTTSVSGGSGASAGTLGQAGAADTLGDAGAAGSSEAGASGSVGGDGYPCGAGNVGEASAELDCIVGQSFCYVRQGLPAQMPTGEAGTGGAHFAVVNFAACRDFATDGPQQCAATPTCACLCRTFDCQFQCKCSELNGLPRVTCGPI